MKKIYWALTLILFLLVHFPLLSQTTDVKNYPGGTLAGHVLVLRSKGELVNGKSDKVFTIVMLQSGSYAFSALANMAAGTTYQLLINGMVWGDLVAGSNGWQTVGGNLPRITLSAASHEIRIKGINTHVPMVEEISLLLPAGSSGRSAENKWDEFIQSVQQNANSGNINQQNRGGSVEKVLPNPEGEYSHAIDTTFAYSHFSWIYLNAGSYTFTTSGSTVSRSLAVFNPADFAISASNVNGGPGGESSVTIGAAKPGYYNILLRPAVSGASGTTNILMNGTTIVSGAVIAGKYYSTPVHRGGALNYFTCKITGDTRIFVSRYAASSIRGYNDDYSGGGGTWNWGLASRIKKDFTGPDTVQYTFVCAYSPTSTGICDIYMGCGNSNVPQLEPQNFPLLTPDDAVRSAPANYIYNCISWSGGVTSYWAWPPGSLSTYSCTGSNPLQCFDNFYNNNPVRYPGAWNYTRAGATEANSVVDLWRRAAAGSYQHASVKEPGNNHPHGYDWESKPGSTNRTLHPRYALEQPNWYGFVSDYYKHAGTFARNAGAESGIATDADAVKAGLAIFDKASLTKEAEEKLTKMLEKTNGSFSRSFDALYKAWDATKVVYSTLSDPAAYCKNKEYKALEAFAKANPRAAMLMTFDKFIQGDHIISELMLALTMDKYSRLLDEVKSERLANLYTKEGLYRIHGDHDNGVLYIEKILKELQEEIIPEPATDAVTVNVSPNPVSERLVVQVVTKKESRVSVVVTSAQTGMKQVMQKEMILAAGTHSFETSVKDMAGSSGNILAVQVMIDGVVKTVKVMVMK